MLRSLFLGTGYDRFRIPQTLTTDQGSSLMSHQVHEFAKSLKIKLLSSSPYYAQANGQDVTAQSCHHATMHGVVALIAVDCVLLLKPLPR
jgi:hypothetical protein